MNSTFVRQIGLGNATPYPGSTGCHKHHLPGFESNHSVLHI